MPIFIEKNIYQNLYLCPLKLPRKYIGTAKIKESEEKKNVFRKICYSEKHCKIFMKKSEDTKWTLK